MHRSSVPVAALLAIAFFLSCASAPPATEAATVAEPAPLVEEAAAPEAQALTTTTVPAVLAQAAPSRLETGSAGFWPAPESSVPVMRFRATIGDPAALRAWKLSVLPEGGATAARLWRGDAAALPGELAWDGRDEAGLPAAAGSWRAALELDYGTAFAAGRVETAPFILSREAPRVSLALDPPLLVPTEDGVAAPVHIAAAGSPVLAPLAGWQVDILDPSGAVFIRFEDLPPVPAITWDGNGAAGRPVAPGADYTVVLSVRDGYGNLAAAKAVLAVDALPDSGQVAAVEAAGEGLSPNADGRFDSLGFSLRFPRPEAVSAWRLEMVSEAGGLFRTFSGGGGAALPAEARWNGRDDAGDPAPEGRYRAVLHVELGRTWEAETAESGWFLLDRTAPTLSLRASPALFSPDGDGRDDILSIEGSAEGGLAPAATWTLAAHDREGNELASFAGSGGLLELAWDGKPGPGGRPLDYAEDYGLSWRVRDSLGNEAEAAAAFGTDFLVVPEAGGYRVAVPGIVFEAYTADWRSIARELVSRNSSVLDRLATSLNRFPDYRIRLVGHAVMEYWEDEARGRREQEEELLPLSLSRAEAIRVALVERGVDERRFSTVGIGAERPLVPNSDLGNRWMNRRVEFFLVRD